MQSPVPKYSCTNMYMNNVTNQSTENIRTSKVHEVEDSTTYVRTAVLSTIWSRREFIMVWYRRPTQRHWIWWVLNRERNEVCCRICECVVLGINTTQALHLKSYILQCVLQWFVDHHRHLHLTQLSRCCHLWVETQVVDQYTMNEGLW